MRYLDRLAVDYRNGIRAGRNKIDLLFFVEPTDMKEFVRPFSDLKPKTQELSEKRIPNGLFKKLVYYTGFGIGMLSS